MWYTPKDLCLVGGVAVPLDRTSLPTLGYTLRGPSISGLGRSSSVVMRLSTVATYLYTSSAVADILGKRSSSSAARALSPAGDVFAEHARHAKREVQEPLIKPHDFGTASHHGIARLQIESELFWDFRPFVSAPTSTISTISGNLRTLAHGLSLRALVLDRHRPRHTQPGLPHDPRPQLWRCSGSIIVLQSILVRRWIDLLS